MEHQRELTTAHNLMVLPLSQGADSITGIFSDSHSLGIIMLGDRKLAQPVILDATPWMHPKCRKIQSIIIIRQHTIPQQVSPSFSWGTSVQPVDYLRLIYAPLTRTDLLHLMLRP